MRKMIRCGKLTDLAGWPRDLEKDPDALFECGFVMKEGEVYPVGNGVKE